MSQFRVHVVKDPNQINTVFIEPGEYYGFDPATKVLKRYSFEEVIQEVQDTWGPPNNDVVTFDRHTAQHIIVPRMDSKADKDRLTWPFVMLLHRNDPSITSASDLRKKEPTMKQIEDANVKKVYDKLKEKGYIKDAPVPKQEVQKAEDMYHLRLTPVELAPAPADITQGIRRKSRRKSRKSSRK